MIFIIGLHLYHFDDVIRSVRASFREEKVTGLAVPSGKYVLDNYVEECFETLVAYHSGRSDCFDRGLCIAAVSTPRTNFSSLAHSFFPFALYEQVNFPRTFSHSESQRRRDKNELTRILLADLRRLVKIKNVTNTYLKSRANRTPLLLPLRHFGEDVLRGSLERLWAGLPSTSDPIGLVEAAAAAVEESHPFKKREGAKCGSFSNSKGVWFSVPGRDLHASAHANAAGHNSKCFLNAMVRVGGLVRDGFHYDCTREGATYSGRFANCHDEQMQKAGKPHINVYPNDFIR